MNTKPVMVGGLVVGLIVSALVAKQFLMAKANSSVEPRLDPQSLTERPVDAPVGDISVAASAIGNDAAVAKAVVEEFITACKQGLAGQARECFGVDGLLGWSTDNFISNYRRTFAACEQVTGAEFVGEAAARVTTESGATVESRWAHPSRRGKKVKTIMTYTVERLKEGWKITNVVSSEQLFK